MVTFRDQSFTLSAVIESCINTRYCHIYILVK